MSSKEQTELFLKLVRLGVENDSDGHVSTASDVNWNAIKEGVS